MHNAGVEVVKDAGDARILRVYPDSHKCLYQSGQYGSLGLASDRNPGKLVKRPYSVSSSIVDVATGRLVDPKETRYYEFYFNRVDSSRDGCERLTPKLFHLKSGDRIFCGPKVVGHYTLEKVPETHNVLLMSTTTGEAANNSIVNQLLLGKRSVLVCHLLVGAPGWRSLYEQEHAVLAEAFGNYRAISLWMDSYRPLEAQMRKCLADPTFAVQTLGFELIPEKTVVFLCGDPEMIGAPQKRGGWNYEFSDSGLIPLLTGSRFEVMTRFKRGNVAYESYW